MKVAIQMGYGMMNLATRLLTKWEGGTVIASPRDQDAKQIIRFGAQVADLGGEMMVDPQCYVRTANHGRLTSHGHWKTYRRVSTNSLGTPESCKRIIGSLTKLSASASATAFIVPGQTTDHVDQTWCKLQMALCQAAREGWGGEVIATVSLDSAAMCNEEDVEAVIEQAGEWPVDGYYLVCESPTNYLVSDVNWLSNRMNLAAGLKLLGRKVIVGYCNHQAIPLACAGVDAIASGKWMKVRSFQPDEMFFIAEEESISRRATWYYAAAALTEYKKPTLDRAKRAKVLKELKPPADVPSSIGEMLFTGAEPSVIRWGETEASVHYLDSLYRQVLNVSRSTYKQTRGAVTALLDNARHKLRLMTRNRVRGEYRDFSAVLVETESALDRLDATRGPLLARWWATGNERDDE